MKIECALEGDYRAMEGKFCHVEGDYIWRRAICLSWMQLCVMKCEFMP